MKKILNRVWPFLLALTLLLTLTACSAESASEEDAGETAIEYVSSEALASALRDKYAAMEQVRYAAPCADVPRDQVFSFPVSYDPKEVGVEYYTDMYRVFLDADLTIEVNAFYDHLDRGSENSRIMISPPDSYPSMAVYPAYIDPENGDTVYITDDLDYINQEYALNHWGQFSQMYIVQYRDSETGEKLEKPAATLVLFAPGPLDAPTIAFSATEDGRAAMSWNEVPGATSYLLVRIGTYNDMLDSAFPIARTGNTAWTAEGGWSHMNFYFSTNEETEDEALSGVTLSPETEREIIEEIEEEYGVDLSDFSFKDNGGVESHYYTVLAMNDAHELSCVGNLIKAADIRGNLPYTLAGNAIRQEGEDTLYRAETIGLLPSHLPVTMCDGKTVERLIVYDFDNIMVSEQHSRVKIPYMVEGTTFAGSISVHDIDILTLHADLEAVRRRQESLRGRGGNVGAEWDFEAKGTEQQDGEQHEVTLTEDTVFASSALCEYLALHMLAAETAIDLSEFPEAEDKDYLFDAWMEAIYQNPLILGASRAGYDHEQQILRVEYTEGAESILQKQQKLREKAAQVVSEIVTPEMSDYDMEIAINNYICDIAEYDMDALKNAEKNNFAFADPEFNDSFTAYGVLIKEAGVCSSYAAAFKLLADAAGLESIVVTGSLEGDLPHAWNRVRIDGEWRSVDATNNDNPLLFNALLNLPDTAAALALVEDTKYMTDSCLYLYTADDDSYEYYRRSDRYFATDHIASMLANGLKQDGSVTLRTDYGLDNEAFQSITQEVMQRMRIANLYGYTYLGVIHLSLDAPA